MMKLRPACRGKKREIFFGSQRIIYELEQDEINSLRITVFPELRVRVKAPLKRSVNEVDAKVKKKASWIIKQQNFFRRFLPALPEKRYVSGESHYYLGRQYTLKVIQSRGARGVKLKGKYLQATVPNRNDKRYIEKVLRDWYKNHAKSLFRKRLEKCVSQVSKHGITTPNLRIQKMTRRWGSYSPNGTVILNLDLIKAPVYCVDYVIIHELCHSLEPNHGPLFESLITRCLPDWRKRKERLETVIIS